MLPTSYAPTRSPTLISPFARPLTPRSRFDGNAYRAPAPSPPGAGSPSWSVVLSPPLVLPRALQAAASRAVSIAAHDPADDERTIVPRPAHNGCSQTSALGSVETIKPFRAACAAAAAAPTPRTSRSSLTPQTSRWLGTGRGGFPAPSPEAFPWRERERERAPPASSPSWHHPSSRPITASPPFRPGHPGYTHTWGSPVAAPRAPSSWRDPQDSDETFDLGSWVREIDGALAAARAQAVEERGEGAQGAGRAAEGVASEEQALGRLQLSAEEIGRYRAWKARIREGLE